MAGRSEGPPPVKRSKPVAGWLLRAPTLANVLPAVAFRPRGSGHDGQAKPAERHGTHAGM